jgi:dTDP-4-dehydrorhamnose reductase
MEVWRGAERLRAEGVAVRAVTVWSLLGAFDWNSLLTRDDGFYESGAYDLRGGTPRTTAIAHMIDEIAHCGDFDHPTLAVPGWWRRSVRMLSPAAAATECVPAISVVEANTTTPNAAARLPGRPIVITGATGRLAQGFIRAAELRGLAYRLFSHAELDITDEAAVEQALHRFDAWAVINCAGYSRVDDAERNQQLCMQANTRGAATLAHVCARSGTPLVTFSSDHVFDGTKREPYLETDEPFALNVYGRSKLLAERQVLAAFPDALVVRPGKVFAPLESDDFIRNSLRAIARGERVRVENDIRVSGTYLPDLVHATLDLLIDSERGVWHLANSGAVTPEQFLIAAADAAHLDGGQIDGAPTWRLNRPALRPRYRALGSERGQLLPPLEDAIARYCRESPEIREVPGELLATS